MRLNVPGIASHFLRSRITKVCVAIAGSTPAEMIEKAASVVKETPFLEFRLDYLEKPLTTSEFERVVTTHCKARRGEISACTS